MKMVMPGITYLSDYHKYWISKKDRIRNPKFNTYSGLILDLKERSPRAIDYFSKRVGGLIPAEDVALCVVPSSTVGSLTSGICLLAKKLVKAGRLDATACLVRTESIPKAATGGPRRVSEHLRTIRVQYQELIQAKTVYLLDDVMTTGTSFSACRQKLTEAGAAQVICIALGKTVEE